MGWFWRIDGFWSAEGDVVLRLALVLFETRLHTSGEAYGELDETFKPDGILECSEMQPHSGVQILVDR